MGGKKVCGILTEASFDVESGGLAYAVVGIGVNVKHIDFPEELKDIAGSVFGEGEYPPEGRARLCAAVAERFAYHLAHISERTFYAEYKRRCFIVGKRVHVLSGALECDATAVGLDENCFLVVRMDDGQIRTLAAGEVSIRL